MPKPRETEAPKDGEVTGVMEVPCSYGTLEFRRFECSFDHTRIVSWAHFCVSFVECFSDKDRNAAIEFCTTPVEQALEARLHILGQMNTVLDAPREITSENAPSMTTLKVDQDKIRDIIGKGGATIRQITEESGATVDIDDDGTVKVFGQNAAARDAAIEMIQAITAEAEVGEIYTGKVARIVDFGAFVTILPGKDGLVHISQIAEERVENVTDYLSEGQEVQVKVLDVDQRGRIKLSMREVAADAADAAVDSVDSAEPEEESLAQE